MIKRNSAFWRPTAYVRRAQRLFVDLLGGGEEWGCRSQPNIIRGGVGADPSHTYIFAAKEITPDHRAAMAWFASNEPIDVIGVEHGAGPANPVRIFLALRRRGKTLEFADYRLLWFKNTPYAQLVPLAEGRVIILKAGRLILIEGAPWPDHEDRQRGLVEGARLVRETIWSD